MHVSWAFRDQKFQDAALASGASHLKWPTSKHNHQENGAPCSLALDVFQINEDGMAVFDPIFCARLNAASVVAGYKLRWGGEFKSLGDAGHFELI